MRKHKPYTFPSLAFFLLSSIHGLMASDRSFQDGDLNAKKQYRNATARKNLVDRQSLSIDDIKGIYQEGNDNSISYLEQKKEIWEERIENAQEKILELNQEGAKIIDIKTASKVTGYEEYILEKDDYGTLFYLTEVEHTFLDQHSENHKHALKFLFESMLKVCKDNLQKYDKKIEEVKAHGLSFQTKLDHKADETQIKLPELQQTIDPKSLRSQKKGFSASETHARWITENKGNLTLIDEFGSSSEYKFLIVIEKAHPDFFPFYHSTSSAVGFFYDVVHTIRTYKDGIKYNPNTVFFRSKESSFPSIEKFWTSVKTMYPDGFLHPNAGIKQAETDFPKNWHDHRQYFKDQIMAANLTYYGNGAYKQNALDPGESALDFYKANSNVSSVDIEKHLTSYLTDMGIDPSRSYRYLSLFEKFSDALKGNILYQIFIHQDTVNDLVTLCGPWAEPLNIEGTISSPDTSTILNAYRTNPESLSYTNYAGEQLLGRNDIQARILVTSKLHNPDKVTTFRYKDSKPLKSIGYEDELERLVKEDMFAFFLQKKE